MMKKFANNVTSSDAILAIENCVGTFMFRGKSKIIVNCPEDLTELNNEIKKYGIICYNCDKIGVSKRLRREFLSISYHNTWKAVIEEIDTNIKKKPSLNLKTDYTLFILKYPMLIRVLFNIFYIFHAKIFSHKQTTVFASYNSLYEINFIDKFNLITPRKLEEPWVRTIKNCIKKAFRIIKLITNPLIIIFEIDYE